MKGLRLRGSGMGVDRRPCSDSRHVTAPYKLSFFIIIIMGVITRSPSTSKWIPAYQISTF